MSKPRLNRLFNARSGRALDVAVDHGAFHEHHFLTGIEDMAKTVATLVDAGPTPCSSPSARPHCCSPVPGKQKPG
ncbi:hypothetical protein HR12_26595, partial [Microbacterium sp. SUBG005]